MNDLKLNSILDPVFSGTAWNLIPQEYIQHIQSVASKFPLSITKYMVLESRLSRVKDQVDFLFCVTRAERDSFNDFLSQVGNNLHLHSTKNWKVITDFCKEWGRPSSHLFKNVISTWLEFDSKLESNDDFNPGFFFGSNSFFSKQLIQADDSPNWLFESALPILLGGKIPPMLEHNLKNWVRLLPNGAFVFQVGVFFSRKNSPLRICFTGIPPKMIISYLRLINYPYDLTTIQQIINDLTNICEFHLDLDMQDGIGPTIGLECSQGRFQSQGMIHNDINLMDYLVTNGWCSKLKRDEILKFPGFMTISESNYHEAEFNQESGNKNKSPFLSTLEKDFLHVKLVFSPNHPVEAKIYLKVFHDSLSQLDVVKKNLQFETRKVLFQTSE